MSGATDDNVKSFVIDIQRVTNYSSCLGLDGNRAPNGATPSFPDAEGCEQLIEHALVVDLAGDFAEGAQGPAKIACQEFGGRPAGYFCERVLDTDAGFREIVGVPDVDGYPLVPDGRLQPLRQPLNLREERIESVAAQRTDGDCRTRFCGGRKGFSGRAPS